MPKGHSTYLDLLRLAAALAVFFSHAAYQRFTHGALFVPKHLAHEAVVVFFVLSGYVICYVAHERETRSTDYLISRAARIYSVAIPALIITFLVDSWLIRSGGDIVSVRTYQITQVWKYLLIFLTFTTDIWFLGDAFSNAPYWSLCYEVWYYISFASIFFLHGRTRLIAITVVLMIMGPRLWLLFPVWLVGAATYMLHRGGGNPGVGASRWLFAASLVALAALWGCGLDAKVDDLANALSNGWMVTHLRYSQFFVGDWMTGILLAINLYAARSADLRFGALARPIIWAAGYSFTLYLVHFPLLELFERFDLPAPVLLLTVLVGVFAAGQVTERQKDQIRTALRRLILRPA